MAGLELLFNCVANSITCSQDALICFVHWEIVKNGYKCLGIGDEKCIHVLTYPFCSFSVFKNTDELITKLKSSLLPPKKEERQGKTEKKTKSERVSNLRDPHSDPLLIPTRGPPSRHPPNWPDPMAPFAAGGADLDPFGGRAGGMIVDPLRAGFPRSGFDPSSGIPGVLPPGAVPPGARFDPFGPVGRHRPGPDPDHMPPPGYDDMFM
uniref:Proteasome inhibitor PI31 subunit n=1 Tax=Sinocyclocheilus grahami TaxID=75366 RepID=A0A672SKJ2_SINGR